MIKATSIWSGFCFTKTLEGFIPALNKTAQFKIENIDAEGEFATIKTTRQTGGYDIRSFKLHLTPSTPIPDLKVGMSVLFKFKEKSWCGLVSGVNFAI